MDQAQLYRMQQEQHDQATNQAAQVVDLTATFLNKRVKPSKAGMLTSGYKKHYENLTGVVKNILVGPVCGLEIAWEDGSTSQSLAYMVEITED